MLVALGLRRPACAAARRALSSAPAPLLAFDVGAANKPHPRKKGPGEDAHFVVRTRGRAVMGVGDGVGGAGDSGVYAARLMEAADALCRQGAGCAGAPGELLHRAWEAVDVEGRSTASLVELDGAAPRLRAANLGDSGYWLLRRSARGTLAIAHRSASQQHGFNCPYQLGRLGGEELNGPADAVLSEHDLQEGDLVLLATDGCFDAMFPLEVLEVVAGALGAGADAQGVATTLVEAAVELSKDTQRISPVVAKMNNIGLVARGREAQDDVTVCVAKVRREHATGREF